MITSLVKVGGELQLCGPGQTASTACCHAPSSMAWMVLSSPSQEGGGKGEGLFAMGHALRWPPSLASLKGKCALGPFLSILVIECQHKCLNVNLCSWMNKVQI
jgi:hypothetical protein